MPLPDGVLTALAELLEGSGITQSDLQLLKENRLFAKKAVSAFLAVCQEARNLDSELPNSPGFALIYPDEFGGFYISRANDMLADLSTESRGHAVRILAAIIFLTKKRPTIRLSAASTGCVLGISRQAAARGLKTAGITLEQLVERLRIA